MAVLMGAYDEQAKADSGFEALPAGTYTVRITDGDWKDTKKGDGKYLQIGMTVIEGDYNGRKIFSRFNLQNKSQEAVKIANSQFAALREALGILHPKDTEDLKGPRFQVVLRCVKRNDNGEMTNEIGRYVKKGETATTPQQVASAPPWKRNAPPAELAQSDMPF